ncbi:SDR family oxidoreductase [Caballeronia cordobensis]|uniref:SDR family oxidoreductase n=1 Tax=Caballeronia cordobensis TaxID=1353886 RepID=UPI00045EE735|nr:short-chain dehydrogenase/reductase [Burkholderia sp. RPE67]
MSHTPSPVFRADACANRFVLISGGSKGIGLACAHAFAAAGARVALIGRDRAALDAAVEAIGGARAFGLAHDLSAPDTAEAVLAELAQRGETVDVLVNSAGSSAAGPFLTLPDQAWHDSFALKIMATVRLVRAVLPGMIARQAGHIVSIAGNSALGPDASMLPSVMANATLIALTKALSDAHSADGVRLNCVNPGPTMTGRLRGIIAAAAAREQIEPAAIEARLLAKTPSRRFATPDEIAATVLFLCSGAAPNLVGTQLTIDGGATR